MLEKFSKIDSPLILIVVFAGITEVMSSLALPFLDHEAQHTLVWFLFLFPFGLVAAFFLTFNLNPKALYIPPADDRPDRLLRRLDAHHEAFILWRKLVASVHPKESLQRVAREAEQWWERNCLLLDADCRKAFRNTVIAVHVHRIHLDGGMSASEIKANWKEITDTGVLIVCGVDFPSVTAETPTPPEMPFMPTEPTLQS
jgi:hypothetical protein